MIITINIIIDMLLINPYTISGATIGNASKNIKLSIVKVNKKRIIIKMKNCSKKNNIAYYPGFSLQRYTKKKWIRVKFLKNRGRFAKTNILNKNDTKIVKIKWTKYFGKSLRKGKYRINFIKRKSFRL